MMSSERNGRTFSRKSPLKLLKRLADGMGMTLKLEIPHHIGKISYDYCRK